MRRSRVKKTVSIFLIVLVLCSLALLSACGEKENRGYDDSLISPEWYSEKMNMKDANDYSEEYLETSGKRHSTGWGYPVMVTFEDLVARSSVIIRGRILGFDFMKVKHATLDSTETFTKYYVEVLDVLRGETYNDKVVEFIVAGGEDNDQIFRNNDYVFTVGDEYLLFMWMPKTMGTSYYPDGDYYTLTDGTAGYYKSSDETVKNAKGLAVPKSFRPAMPTNVKDETLYYLDFIEEIKEYNDRLPIDEYAMRKQFESAYANNLKSGMMTQEEYDEAMAEFGKYGTILYYTEPEGA